MSDMVKLGMKRKEMYPASTAKTEKSYDDEVVYPEISVSGKLAEKMGAADLKEGDVVEVPVVLKVKRHSKTEEGGDTEYSMTLCVEKMGNMTEVEKDIDDELENEELPTTNALRSLEEPRDGWGDE